MGLCHCVAYGLRAQLNKHGTLNCILESGSFVVTHRMGAQPHYTRLSFCFAGGGGGGGGGTRGSLPYGNKKIMKITF